MRVSFVSDIHGNSAALADVAARAEQLIVLGDLLDYIDYRDPGAGIVGAAFGRGPVQQLIDLRTVGDFAGMHVLSVALWETLADPRGTLDAIVDAKYRLVVEALSRASRPPLLILGNVDELDRWTAVADGTIDMVDGQVIELDGVRLGFAAGGASRRAGPPPDPATDDRPWRPFIKPAADFARTVASLGAVDVLCSHVPPDLALMRYDRVPARAEMFGPGLLESIDEHRPRLALSGHVHQPLVQRTRRGRTECVNVGHFARWSTPFEVRW